VAGSRAIVVVALGTAQTLAWASSYYLPAILANPIARDLGISGTAVFAAFSAALLLSAALGPAVGRAIDVAPADELENRRGIRFEREIAEFVDDQELRFGVVHQSLLDSALGVRLG
jgi:hypothetical protein